MTFDETHEEVKPFIELSKLTEVGIQLLISST